MVSVRRGTQTASRTQSEYRRTHSLSRDQAIESICLPRNSRGVHRPVLVGRRTRRQFCFTRVNRDFRFACPRWPLYTPKGSAAHETLVRHSIVPLQRPVAQLGRPCDQLKSLRSGHFADTVPDVCPFVARRAARAAARQSAGAGSAQIITNPVRLVLNILTALKRSPLGLDLYLWLAYRTFTLERQLQLSWRQVYRQFGVDPAKAGNRRTVDDFRKEFCGLKAGVELAYTLANIWQALGIAFRYMARHRARYRPQP